MQLVGKDLKTPAQLSSENRCLRFGINFHLPPLLAFGVAKAPARLHFCSVSPEPLSRLKISCAGKHVVDIH